MDETIMGGQGGGFQVDIPASTAVAHARPVNFKLQVEAEVSDPASARPCIPTAVNVQQLDLGAVCMTACCQGVISVCTTAFTTCGGHLQQQESSVAFCQQAWCEKRQKN